jgi:hypothetical protein
MANVEKAQEAIATSYVSSCVGMQCLTVAKLNVGNNRCGRPLSHIKAVQISLTDRSMCVGRQDNEAKGCCGQEDSDDQKGGDGLSLGTGKAEGCWPSRRQVTFSRIPSSTLAWFRPYNLRPLTFNSALALKPTQPVDTPTISHDVTTYSTYTTSHHHITSVSMNGNDKTWVPGRPQTFTNYNPYDRQHLKLSGSGWRAEWTEGRPALRRLRAMMRRYLPSWNGGHGRDVPLTTRATSDPLSVGPAPSIHTMRFVLMCAVWYMTSALSSNTGKVILNQFRYPVTLTIIQFAFVAGYCLLIMSPLLRFSKIRAPTRSIIRTTLPMGMFQVGGHMFSSMAISRIPVSTVHTIKVRTCLDPVMQILISYSGTVSTLHRCRLCFPLWG